MPIADLMRGGWTMMPDRTAITFRNRTAPGTYTNSTVNNCFRRGRGLVEAEPTAGVYVKQMADWFIPKTMLPAQPVPGDIVRLPATTNTRSPYYGLNGDYYILPEGVQEAGALGCWRCTCGLFFLQPEMTETVNVYRPTFASGDGGRMDISSSTLIATNIEVYIQDVDSFGGPVPITMDDALGKVQVPQAMRCYLPIALRIQPHDYLVGEDGTHYSIRNEVFVGLLGALQAIDLEILK